MTAPYCAECGNHVAPELDHVEVAAETIHIEDRNERDDYYFHPECWEHVSDGWVMPA